MHIASKFTAGDAQAWTDSPFTLPDGTLATALTHALSYSFRGPIKTAGVDVACSVLASGWKGALSNAQSAALNGGNTTLIWFWQAVVSSLADGTRTTVGGGQLSVLPNLAALAAGTSIYDGRSDAERNLAAVKAEITARIKGGVTLEYTIGNRSLKKEPMDALLKLQTRLAQDVAREKTAQAVANGLGNPGRVMVRFR